MASNRSPSPLSSRNPRNSETNSSLRRSFNGNPFAKPSALTNPRSFNAPTPTNSPATIDQTKRHLIGRENLGSSRFQEEKENEKAAKIRSPAKGCSKSFMAPTISAASKFTPSPRKKVLGEKNELTRTSIQFSENNKGLLCKDLDSKSETTPLNLVKIEQKEIVFEAPSLHELTLSSKNDDLGEVNGDSECVNDLNLGSKIRAFCVHTPNSPFTSPLDADPSLPPYDPKKKFLSPRPQFLHYKPNPRIENFHNDEDDGDDCGEEGVNRLEEVFNLSENLSDTDVTEEEEGEIESGDSIKDSSDDLSDMISEEKELDDEAEVKKVTKTKFFTPSKIVIFLLVPFLIACFSMSFTHPPPMVLSVCKDVRFSDFYHESFKFAAFATETFDDFSQSFKQWSTNLVSYLSDLKSHFSSATDPIQFFNLTIAPAQDELFFEGYIRSDYLDGKNSEKGHNIDWRELEEEMEDEIEMIEGEVEYDMSDEQQGVMVDDVETEIESEEMKEIEILSLGDDKSQVEGVQSDEVLDDGSNEKSQISLTKSEVKPVGEVLGVEYEMKTETESSGADSDVEVSSEIITQSKPVESLLTRLVNDQIMVPISLAISSMVAAASVVILYNKKVKPASVEPMKKKNFKQEAYEPCSSETSSSYEAQSQEKKPKKSNKRDSLASSSNFSMGSPSYGSFTTFERIPIKHGDEEMLTPIRRSSRLMKNKGISS